MPTLPPLSEFETAISGWPSRLKSATATDNGAEPALMGAGAAVGKGRTPLLSRTLTPPLWFAVTISSLPSLLKSPTANENGLGPTSEVNAFGNVPFTFSRTLTLPVLPELTVATSVFPSLLKSATTTDSGLGEVG